MNKGSGYLKTHTFEVRSDLFKFRQLFKIVRIKYNCNIGIKMVAKVSETNDMVRTNEKHTWWDLLNL